MSKIVFDLAERFSSECDTKDSLNRSFFDDSEAFSRIESVVDENDCSLFVDSVDDSSVLLEPEFFDTDFDDQVKIPC